MAETYTFDRTGNISQPTGAATYNVVTDRLMSRVEPGGNRTFVYDRAGNLIQQTKLSTGEVRTFGYDALNRMVSVRQGGVLMARYAYDVLGRRIAKRVYSNASDGVPGYTRFVYHGDNVSFQTDSAGTMGLRLTWGMGTDDLRAVQDAAGQAYYIVQDKLGSVRGLLARDGTWLASARYNPYGDIVALDSAGPRPAIWYSWTGREFDEETGWYYHRARYYSPLIRRFVQEDPIGYRGGANLYAYVGGQALEATDPSGTQAVCSDCGGGGQAALSVLPRIGAAGNVYFNGVAISPMAAATYMNTSRYGDYLTESMNAQTTSWLAANARSRLLDAMAIKPVDKLDFSGNTQLAGGDPWVFLKKGIRLFFDNDKWKGPHIHVWQRGTKFGEIIKDGVIEAHGKGPGIPEAVLKILRDAGYLLRSPIFICVTCKFVDFGKGNELAVKEVVPRSSPDRFPASIESRDFVLESVKRQHTDLRRRDTHNDSA